VGAAAVLLNEPFLAIAPHGCVDAGSALDSAPASKPPLAESAPGALASCEPSPSRESSAGAIARGALGEVALGEDKRRRVRTVLTAAEAISGLSDHDHRS
jgi:hypothetical protein